LTWIKASFPAPRILSASLDGEILMHSERAPHPHTQGTGNPAEARSAALTTWRTLAIDLPLRLAAETMRFTGRRLEEQAKHLASLARCGSLNEAVELQTTFVTKSLDDYRKEAATQLHDVRATAFAKVA
jgi:hypothetical protein